MKLHPDCDYFNELQSDKFAPTSGECDECYRWDICISAYMRGKKPIPIDRLHEFKNKEVWVQSPGIPKYGRKAVVEDVDTNDGKSILSLVNDFTCHEYGRVWEAYPIEGLLPISYER